MPGVNVVILLKKQGWEQLSCGSHVDAWKAFWGRERLLSRMEPPDCWTEGLFFFFNPFDKRLTSDQAMEWPTGKRDSRASHLKAMAQEVLGPGGGATALQTCFFRNTPWKHELPETSGRIAFRGDYAHILNQLGYDRAFATQDGIIIQGQCGVGKTYLGYYILMFQLSKSQTVIFSPEGTTYFLFHSTGVFRTDRLERGQDGRPALRAVLGSKISVIMDIPMGQGPPVVVLDPLFFLIQLCQPFHVNFRYRVQRFGVEFLALDAPSPHSIIAEALIQDKVQLNQHHFKILVENILVFGCRPKLCFQRLDNAQKTQRPHPDYIAYFKTLKEDVFLSIAHLPLQDWDFTGCVRSDPSPDLLVLRRSPTRFPGAMIAVIASRHAAVALRECLDFGTLLAFTNMGAVQFPADDLSDSRVWLFEQLCHSLITSPSSELQSRHIHTFLPWQPVNSPKADGTLELGHLLQPRRVVYFDADLPGFDTGTYAVPLTLLDTYPHAILYVQLEENDRDLADPRTASEQTSLSSQRDKGSDSRKDKRSGRRSSQTPHPGGMGKVAVVLVQVLLHGAADMSPGGWAYIDRIIDVDPRPKYCLVFVTLKGQELDWSAIPDHLVGCLTCYQLQVDLPF
ncbi:unnamed protein product [Peniophora sp. CBMAI 1063]|nr:unnamed protein product [Peniophora sp. CBMAI 1063]